MDRCSGVIGPGWRSSGATVPRAAGGDQARTHVPAQCSPAAEPWASPLLQTQERMPSAFTRAASVLFTTSCAVFGPRSSKWTARLGLLRLLRRLLGLLDLLGRLCGRRGR